MNSGWGRERSWVCVRYNSGALQQGGGKWEITPKNPIKQHYKKETVDQASSKSKEIQPACHSKKRQCHSNSHMNARINIMRVHTHTLFLSWLILGDIMRAALHKEEMEMERGGEEKSNKWRRRSVTAGDWPKIFLLHLSCKQRQEDKCDQKAIMKSWRWLEAAYLSPVTHMCTRTHSCAQWILRNVMCWHMTTLTNTSLRVMQARTLSLHKSIIFCLCATLFRFLK